MSARKKALTANPVLDGTLDVPPAPPKPRAKAEAARLLVRVKPGGPGKRYRAGLGPFTREPQAVEVNPEQAEALKADPMLAVAEAGE